MPRIEYVTVADHADVVNNKLYLMGAGWDAIIQPVGPDGKPQVVHMAIAASVQVGWNETNRRFPFKISVLHEDGQQLGQLSAQVEAGRPAGIPPGSDLRNMLALHMNVAFPQLGIYEVRAEVGDEEHGVEQRSVTFRVNAAPFQMVAPPAPPMSA